MFEKVNYIIYLNYEQCDQFFSIICMAIVGMDSIHNMDGIRMNSI